MINLNRAEDTVTAQTPPTVQSLKAVVHLKPVFPPLNLCFMQISRSHFGGMFGKR